MHKAVIILSFAILIIFFSCEDTAYFVQCSDCTADEPSTAELTAELDPGHYNQALVQIWEGNLEDSILVGNFTWYTKTFTHEVTLNKRYTITATYTIDGSKFVAVDAATPRVRFEKSQCTDPCYYVYDRKCDLRIKYTH